MTSGITSGFIYVFVMGGEFYSRIHLPGYTVTTYRPYDMHLVKDMDITTRDGMLEDLRSTNPITNTGALSEAQVHELKSMLHESLNTVT